MLLTLTVRMLASVVGASLAAFLAVLFARKRSAGFSDRLALAAVLAAGTWHAAAAVSMFHRAVAERPSALLLAVAGQLSIAALALLPPLLAHLAASWSGVRTRLVLAAYASVPPAWWALETARLEPYGWWLAVSLALAAGICIRGSRSAAAPPMQGFLAAFGVALGLIPLALGAGGAGSALPYAAALGPPLVLAWCIYRYNVFGLLIAPRLVFALKMGAVVALYLLLVRRLAGFVEDEFEVFGPLVELALIVAAALIWLPLYGWMSRFLSRRTDLYATFSRRLIEDAARILDLGKRAQFLAAEVGRSFDLHRVLLAAGDGAPICGRFGPDLGPPAGPPLEKLAALMRVRRCDVVRANSPDHREAAALVSGLGFNYLIPLWYEDRLLGLLLIDTSPRMFLNEDEPILLALSGQISHSLEAARMVEEKIALERTLAHQEHLAALGRAAATLAHEVKNPLSSIKTLTQLMREDPEVEGRYARDLGFILGEVDRLNRTVQQLLSFSRPAAALQEEVDVSELLTVTAEVLAREHASGGIRIEHRIEPGLRLRRASVEALQQVVLNLALNAVESSPPGSTVRLEAASAPAASIVMTVCDDGPGIPSEIRERIFDPFFTTRHKGTGLGLAIVKKNVEQMRGSIEIVSPAGGERGTRVAVTLPCE